MTDDGFFLNNQIDDFPGKGYHKRQRDFGFYPIFLFLVSNFSSVCVQQYNIVVFTFLTLKCEQTNLNFRFSFSSS